MNALACRRDGKILPSRAAQCNLNVGRSFIRDSTEKEPVMPSHVLSIAEIRDLFAAEIADAGGVVSEAYDDGRLLFARSLLPGLADVRPNDKLQGGVALKASEREICLHPYLFRLVCKNGAIRAHAIQTRRIDLSDTLLPEVAAEALREAVRACCAEETFTEGIDEARSSTRSQVDLALEMIPMLAQMQRTLNPAVVHQILFRLMGETDRSRFALMNAVTSVARETKDQDLRWRLEEFGGGVPVSRPIGPVNPSHRATVDPWKVEPDRTDRETIGSWAAVQADVAQW
jgi:hypothetical protein